MRWLVIALALGACGGKSSEAPVPIGALDRGCQVDADCTMTGDPTCCGTSCGTNFGDAVNAKAWAKAREARDERCKGEDCHVMCQKLPDCRAETFAVCKAGTCTPEVRPNETCTKLGVSPDEYCEQDDDCGIASERDCCPVCDGAVMTRVALVRARAEAQKRCQQAPRECNEVKCPARAAACVNHRCAERP